MDERRILHNLRNQWGISEEDILSTRLEAADLVEQRGREVEKLKNEIEELKEKFTPGPLCGVYG